MMCAAARQCRWWRCVSIPPWMPPLLLSLLFLPGARGHADTTKIPFLDVAQQPSGGVNLAKVTGLLNDKTDAWDQVSILNVPEAQWTYADAAALDIAYTRTTWWGRIGLTNSSGAPLRRILEIRSPLIDYLDVQVVDGQHVITTYQVGDQRLVSARPIQSRNLAFPVDLPGGAQRQVVLRFSLKDGAFDIAPIFLWTEAAYAEYQNKDNLLLGGYFGANLSLAIYNLILFFTSRDRNFLRYAVFLAILGLWYFGYRGLGYLYLWPASPWINNLLGLFMSPLVLATSIWFVSHYLETGQRTPRIHRMLLWIFVGLLIPPSLMIGDILGQTVPIVAGFYLLTALMLVLFFTYLSASIFIYLQGYTPALFFIVAWFCISMGVFFYQVSTFGSGLIPVSVWTENAVAIGSMLEFQLLALGLGYRYKRLQDRYSVLERDAYHNQLRQNFLDTISHELRTPLSIIQTTTENLLARADGQRLDILRPYHKILRAIERMTGLINGYLSDVENGTARSPTRIESCDPRALLHDAVRSARLFAENHRIRIESPDLPEAFVCDRRLTALALRNLVDNAVKYSPPSSRILLRGGRVKLGMWLAVENEGCSLTPEQAHQIFEPGYRLSSQTPGSGYGLTLARRVIEQQGGTLDLHVTRDGWCAFRMVLPEHEPPSVGDEENPGG